MSFNDLILSLLDKQNIEFDTIHAPDAISLKEDWLEKTVPLDNVSRVHMLQDNEGIVIALYPANHQINLTRLQNILKRNLRFIDTNAVANKTQAVLSDSSHSNISMKDIQVIIDERLTDRDHVYFEAPNSCSLLKVVGEDMQLLSDDTLIGSRFSDCPDTQKKKTDHQKRLNIRERINKIDRLPALPDMPARILAVRNSPYSTIDDLVAIIENDLSLTSQIIRYSNSAMFHTNSPVISLRDAVFRVLGYETVLHLTLGYALGRVFKLPEKGPLGNMHFWKHSTYSAALAQQLASAMPRSIRPKPGMAYLCGLLHDIGFLVLHLFFKNEHAWLNKMIDVNPERSILEIENRLLGITHNELGLWLLESWKMPEELCVTVKEHHNENYDGKHAEYALLLNLSERLLKMHGMSDTDTDEIPDQLLNRLGLSEEDAFLITDEVLQGGDILSEMAISVRA